MLILNVDTTFGDVLWATSKQYHILSGPPCNKGYLSFIPLLAYPSQMSRNSVKRHIWGCEKRSRDAGKSKGQWLKKQGMRNIKSSQFKNDIIKGQHQETTLKYFATDMLIYWRWWSSGPLFTNTQHLVISQVLIYRYQSYTTQST